MPVHAPSRQPTIPVETATLLPDGTPADEASPRRRRHLERAAWSCLVAWAFVGPLLAAGLASRLQVAQKRPRPLRGVLDEAVVAVERDEKTGEAGRGLYGVFTDSLKGAKYVDLTHAFAPESPVWPGFGAAAFGASKAGADMEGFVEEGQEFTYEKHGFQATRFVLTTDQYGTQLDPPAHWNELGAAISDVPATVALRPLVVLEVHEKVAANASYHATLEDAAAWEEKYGRIPEGSVVMVRSDWSKGWHRYSKEGLPAKYPGVTLALLQWLHLKRRILFHGHEPLDTDMTPTLEGEAWLMHHDFMQAEGVAHLDLVPPHGCLVSIGFARPLGGLGGFARYVAVCPPGAAHGATVEEAPGAPLPQFRAPLRRGEDGVMRRKEGAEPTEYCRVKAALGCTSAGPVWK